MPTIEQNRALWGSGYGWPANGDEWSGAWGGPEAQWQTTLLPRIGRFLPAGRVLEIGPGRGRWSAYLIDRANEYVGVDVAESCVAFCRSRFGAVSHARFHANDGRSLDAVADASIDFAFSFDSLVHAELDTLEAYFRELSRTLAPEGAAFIHHSNLGELDSTARRLARRLERLSRRLPAARRALRRLGLAPREHWRATSVSAVAAARSAERAGLSCIAQELVPWGPAGGPEIDCFTLLTRPGSRRDRPNRVVRNPDFTAEARSAAAVARLYLSLRPEDDRARAG